jgi:hypothetical protein
LALNLTRIQLFAQRGTNEPVAHHLVRETQFFIEWIIPGIDLATDMALATTLVDLQRLLSRWKLEAITFFIAGFTLIKYAGYRGYGGAASILRT